MNLIFRSLLQYTSKIYPVEQKRVEFSQHSHLDIFEDHITILDTE